MPANFDPQRDQSAMAYHPMQIRRVTKYEFLKAGGLRAALARPDHLGDADLHRSCRSRPEQS